MSESFIRGKVISIQHEKKKITIEYEEKNKVRTIQAVVDDKEQEKLIEQKLIKKTHRFLVGDHVKFVIRKSGSGFYAANVIYEYNNALNAILNKANIENKFLGYIKLIDDAIFIKEIDSYLFFPLQLSKFEIAPTMSDAEKPVSFKLLHIESPEKTIAQLYNHQYTKAYTTAIKNYKSGTASSAVVNKITPFAIYVGIIDNQIECKIPLDDTLSSLTNNNTLTVGSTIEVKIKHINNDRIILEHVIV